MKEILLVCGVGLLSIIVSRVGLFTQKAEQTLQQQQNEAFNADLIERVKQEKQKQAANEKQ